MLIKKMLLENRHIFTQPLHKIYYVYSFWQNSYKELQIALGNSIIFVEGFRKTLFEDLHLLGRNEQSPSAAVVFDDILETLIQDRENLKIFTANCHHLNLCCILVSQNLMVANDTYRNIMKQANFFIIFESVRGRSSLKSLSSQIFGDSKFLPGAMQIIRQTARGYMIIDLRPGIDERIRVRQNLCFPGEDMFVFIQ